jgi:hypothetical protein
MVLFSFVPNLKTVAIGCAWSAYLLVWFHWTSINIFDGDKNTVIHQPTKGIYQMNELTEVGTIIVTTYQSQDASWDSKDIRIADLECALRLVQRHLQNAMNASSPLWASIEISTSLRIIRDYIAE